MTKLLWKDWHVYRSVTLGSFILMLFIYGLAMAALVATSGKYPITLRHILESVQVASAIALWTTLVLSAVYSGAAFALERRERSADFLAMLPISRGRIVLSKWIVSFSMVTVLLVANTTILFVCMWLDHNNRSVRADGERIVVITYSATIMAFGVSWLLSTFLESAAFAFGISLAATLGTIAMIGLYGVRSDAKNDQTIFQILVIATLAGLIAFIGGTVYYLRRKRP